MVFFCLKYLQNDKQYRLEWVFTYFANNMTTCIAARPVNVAQSTDKALEYVIRSEFVRQCRYLMNIVCNQELPSGMSCYWATTNERGNSEKENGDNETVVISHTRADLQHDCKLVASCEMEQLH